MSNNIASQAERESPIIVIGTARSGTNLLARILNTHSRIRVSGPIHIMQTLARLQPTYGDLSDDKQMRALIRDARLLAANHTVPWKKVPSTEDVLAALPQRSVFGVMAALCELDARAAGKVRWCDKSLGMIDHVDAVRSVYPGARFIWLVRDPRDVAASARGSVFLPCHPERTARLWQQQQERGMQLAEALPGAVHLLRYEDLVGEPATTLERLCAFLREHYEPGMLDYHSRDPEAQRYAELSTSWTNLGKPLLANNTQKYMNKLTADDVAAVETICAPAMMYLGYPATQQPVSSAQLASPGHRASVLAASAMMRLKVEIVSARNDKSHWPRWRRTVLDHWITLRQRLRGTRH
ncbi:sulfotransferase family protein [Brucella sp. IR073]|uniref:sulfotransferase family protein n=1 Tax=unclassified Brucella TaxID=2632610 RepID=UPI003B987589